MSNQYQTGQPDEDGKTVTESGRSSRSAVGSELVVPWSVIVGATSPWYGSGLTQ